MKNKALLLKLGGLLLFLLFLSGFSWNWGQQEKLQLGNGLFSWKNSVLDAREREALFAQMEELALTELYQHFSSDVTNEQIQAFLRAAAEHGINVYWLTGEPEWGLDENGSLMVAEIKRASRCNEGLSQAQRLRGVVMDVEPYQTAQWKGDKDGVMSSFVSAMNHARQASEQASLELIACIPYFLDEKGQEKHLAKLLETGCHGLMVMNYNKKDEAEHLQVEAGLANDSGKPLVMIYELQAPGKHDLSERNTYYHDGLSGVAASWSLLQQQVDCQQFSYALHDYEALKEVVGHSQ